MLLLSTFYERFGGNVPNNDPRTLLLDTLVLSAFCERFGGNLPNNNPCTLLLDTLVLSWIWISCQSGGQNAHILHFWMFSAWHVVTFPVKLTYPFFSKISQKITILFAPSMCDSCAHTCLSQWQAPSCNTFKSNFSKNYDLADFVIVDVIFIQNAHILHFLEGFSARHVVKFHEKLTFWFFV